METVVKLSVDSVMISAAIYSTVMIFSAGALTTFGWLVLAPLALGSTAYVASRVYEVGSHLFSKTKETLDEKNQKKPAAAAN